jgi:UDP-N-acetylmuramate dehydrogenase
MNILKDVSLTSFSTMGLGGIAKHLVSISTKEDLVEAITWANQQNLSILVIGGGSNIIWRDEGYDGLVIVNEIKGFQVDQDETGAYLVIGAGENWDDVVGRCADMNLSGIESLSLIPGSSGATPVQNVGAYGQEIAETLITLEAYDTKSRDFVVLDKSECEFGYRSSRFNSLDKGRFIISSITLRLNKTYLTPPFYASLQKYVEDNNIEDYSPVSIRQAVIKIRQNKLPDPKLIHNTGSFFANPIVSEDKLVELNEDFLHVPSWPFSEGQVKVSAAWLIEKAGLKDNHDPVTGMATWAKQPLVLVNEHASSTSDLLAYKREIVGVVESKFGITLIQEPELLP